MSNTEARPQFLSNKEAAELLRLNTKTLDNWRWKGVGPRYMKAGTHVLYKLADVLTWLDSEVQP